MLCTPNNHKVWITYGSTCSSWIINPNVWITATVDAWKPTVAIMVRVTPYRPPVLLVKCHSQLLVLLLSWKVPTMCPSTALFIEWFQGSNRNIQFGTAQRSTDFLFNIFNIYIYIFNGCNASWNTSNPSPRNLTLKFHTSCGLQNSWLHPGPGYVIQTYPNHILSSGCQHDWRWTSRIY